MAYDDTRSVAELRRESERTRAELSQTVETLREKITDTAADIREKVSPEHIKAEVSDYVAEKSRHWIDNLKQQAMDNPMQALAAGTAIAVPALRIMRSVPLPLLMIGAGLALTSSRVRGAVADQVSATLKTPGGNSAVDEAKRLARNEWRSATARAEDAIDDARDAIDETRSVVTDKVAQIRDNAAQTAADLKDRAANLGSAAKDALGSGVDAASEAAREAFETTREKATETFNATRTSAERIVRDNAALVGGIGLAIGALIAASLPTTRVEGATIGEASDALRGKVAEAAGEKFDEAKTAATSAINSAAEKISEAGLGSQASRAAEQAAEKLKTVADEAITTAFEPSQSDHR